jgi:hypothetical protein
LGSERERHFGSLAGADGHVLSLNRDLAVLNDFGPQRVGVLAANFEGRGDKRAPSGGGARGIAVDRQAGVGRQGHDERGRSVGNFFGAFLILRHRLRSRSGSGAARAAAGATGAAAVAAAGGATAVATVATAAVTAEQTAVAATAAAVATVAATVATTVATAVAAAHRVTTTVATAAAVATMQPAEQSAAVATAMAARARASRGMAAVRAGAAPVAMAEFNRFGTAAQGHHEDNTVHFGNLQITKEPTHAEL